MAVKLLPPARSWVTKTDLSRWFRCPYSWWLLDTGQITFAETVDEFAMALIRGGQEYQQVVEASAEPVMLAPGELERLLQTDTRILGTPVYENPRLRIRGCPDGIDAASGALYPVEIKSHRAATRLDGLELAFYWLLLEPQRSRRADPAGVLILRRDGGAAVVRVQVTEAMLAEVRRMLRDIRRARRRGVRPRVCGCVVCSRVRRDEVVASVTARRDVSMLLGVGRVYCRALTASGYRTWDSLAGCDPEAVAAAVTRAGAHGCTASVVQRWLMHAAALATGQPAMRPDAKWPLSGPYIALDLEYVVSPGVDHIWLAGATLADGESAEHRHWWAGSADEVSALLDGLAGMLKERPDLPVVTWAGRSADLPRLAAACSLFARPALIGEITERHVDAFQWCMASLRLPTIGLGLREVSEYLGFRPSSGVADGLQAVMLFHDWRKSQDEQLRQRLIAYNRDDVDALVATVTRIGELCAPGAIAAPGIHVRGDAKMASSPAT